MPARERGESSPSPLPPWIAERAVIALGFARLERPGGRQRRRSTSHGCTSTTDLSFGVVKRLLLSMASPRKVIESAHELWAADHTHGVMEGRWESDTRATLLLRDSLFVQTPQARTGMSEMLRYIMELAGARGAIEKHGLLPDGALEVRLRWA